jgi:molybdopterin converting factor small subunit
MPLPAVIVEFYGVPRMRAKCAELTVHATTVGDALDAIAQSCPALADLRRDDGRLDPRYLLSLDGERFFADLDRPLRDGQRLLLLSADAGG